jgi:hypothetical protein
MSINFNSAISTAGLSNISKSTSGDNTVTNNESQDTQPISNNPMSQLKPLAGILPPAGDMEMKAGEGHSVLPSIASQIPKREDSGDN